jgi:diguanylate cyclase (GGDEF)-like protein/PAS domain S-box-containing protein
VTQKAAAKFLSIMRALAALTAFLLCYVSSGVFVLKYLTQNGVAAFFWPPAGIALAALLSAGARYLPIVFLAAFLANHLAGADVLAGLLYAAVNTLEAMLGWWWLIYLHKIDLTLTHARDYFQLFLCGGLLAPAVGALAGAASLHLVRLNTQGFWENLQYWWMGDSLGVIVITPLWLIWRRLPVITYRARHWLEAVAGFCLLILLGQIVFAGWDIAGLSSYARGFLMFIFITWTAVRLGRHATSLAIAVIVVQIMIGLVSGKGYFAHPQKAVTFGTVWLYMSALAITGMALAIYIHEARALYRQLLRAREQQEQVSAVAHVGGWEFDLAERRLQLSAETFRILDLPKHDAIDVAAALDFIDESERTVHIARGQLAIEQGIGWDVEFKLRTKTGREIWVRSQGKPILENGRVVRLIGALHDLTESRQIQNALRRSELEFRRLVETSSEGVCTLDANGYFTFVNARLAAILGYRSEQLLGTRLLDYVAPAQQAVVEEKILSLSAADSEAYELPLLSQPGKTVWLLAKFSPIRDENGGLTGTLAMMSDINARKAMEQELRQSEERYRQLVESSADAIVVHRSGFIVYANPAALRLLGARDVHELIGRNVLEFVVPEEREIVIERMKLVNKPGGYAPLIEEKFLRLDGTTVDVEVYGTATIYNGVNATMVVARDISDRKRAEEQIRYLGQHDILTGLPNRALLADRLAQTIARAQRHQSFFALLFLDLDNFKTINDSYGHRAGDEFLRQVAERLKSRVRAIDTVSRQGGDEFIILLNELTHPEDAVTIARDICERLSEPLEIEGVQVHASASIGIAVYPRDGDSADALLRNADIAMYHAKSLGRNQYQFFSEELNRITKQRWEIELALKRAILENQFYLLYQPQQNLQTGAIEGFEALIRWLHPVRGELSPLEFLPIAVESGQIAAVGEWVLRTVLTDIAKFDSAGHHDLYFAVNVSALELRQANFAERLQSLLEEYRVPATRLVLDVKESFLIQKTSAATNSIDKLSQLGILFAVDDFGTGYSSLRYLKSLKVHHLKIDHSLISDLTHDADSAAIVRTIIALGQNLRFRILAEGVESREQWEFLRNHGCELVQGFFLSPPLQIAEALKFLSSVVR